MPRASSPASLPGALMGWLHCGEDSRGRPIGYGYAAICDHPGCTTAIARGLAYACGGMHGDNDPDGSCEGYYCYAHLFVWLGEGEGGGVFRCRECCDAGAAVLI